MKLKFNCLQCGKESEYHPKSSSGKYCSNACQQEYTWINVGRPKVLAGQGGNMKRYLIETYGYQCSVPGCGISSWMGKEITLQLDHIDGNSDNNDPANCRLICPNCHTQTDTFCKRNVKNTKRNSYLREYKATNKQVRKAW